MKRDKTIHEELKEMAPFLASLKKNNLFSVPEGYFEQNEQKMLEAVQIEEKVKELRKITQKIEASEVPAGYFEGFPSKILSRAKTTGEINVISIKRSAGWKQWLQVAAVVLAIAIMATPFIKNNVMKQDSNIETALQKVSDAELSSYVSEHSVSFNEDEIATHVSDAKLEQAANTITAPVANDDESLIDVTQIDVNDIQNL